MKTLSEAIRDLKINIAELHRNLLITIIMFSFGTGLVAGLIIGIFIPEIK